MGVLSKQIRLLSVLSAYTIQLIVLVGCGVSSKTAVDPRVVAPAQISESFSIYQDAGTSAPKVAIRKSSLGREFLLQGSIAFQLPIPQGHALRSRIVVFIPEGKQLHMLVAPEGYVVSGQIPSELLLTSFDIVSDTADSVQFDWNSGMSRVFNSSDWYGHDSSGTKDSVPFRMMRVARSRVASAEITPENEMVIRQVGNAEEATYGSEFLTMAEVKYYLTPYRQNPGYVPAPAKGFSTMGFFESSPRFDVDGKSVLNATRFDIRKPIVFAVSANTPKDFRQAVKDGVLYWNRVLPTPMIQVIDAPAGVNAPDIHYNVIQWIPWDQAESAYADAQLNPRTGEILHGQIYLTSTFAVFGKKKIRTLLRQMQEPKKGDTALASHIAFPSLCHFNPSNAYRTSLTELLNSEGSDSRILTASQDFIRSVVAHEVGPTLGLRHNFAASLATENYPLAKAKEVFAEYLRAGLVDASIKPGSSVMDYYSFEESVLIGAMIRLGYPGLKYDVDATAVLYSGKKFKKGEVPLFCTDSQVDSFIDCRRFDAGSSVVEFVKWTTEKKLKNLPLEIYESYTSAKDGVNDDTARLVEEVPLDQDKIASDVLSPRGALLSNFTERKRILSIYAKLNYVSPVNLDSVKKQENDYLLSEINKVGGLEEVLGIIPASYAQELPDRFELIISQKAKDNEASDFSNEELEAIRETVKAVAEKLPGALAKGDLELLGKIPVNWKSTNNELGDHLIRILTKRVDEYLLRTTDERIIAQVEVPIFLGDEKAKDGEPTTQKINASLPKFFYPQDIRKGAAPLLTPADPGDDSDGGILEWGLHERTEYKARLLALLNTSLGCGENPHCRFEKIKPEEVKVIKSETMSDADLATVRKQVTRWVVENQQIVEKFK